MVWPELPSSVWKRVTIFPSGLSRRTSRSAATLSESSDRVRSPNSTCSTVTSSMPRAWRVASMLYAMYFASLSFWFGFTTSDCTALG